MTYSQLSAEERYSIAAMRARRFTVAEIARELGRHRSAIYREVRRNGAKYDGAYRPMFAVEKANGRRRRSRRNRRYTPDHFAVIERLLREDFSRLERPGQPGVDGAAAAAGTSSPAVRGHARWRH